MTPRDRSILTKVHRRVKEALPAGDVLVPEPFITPNYSDVWVQITSTSQTDGRYPGTVYMRNVDATFTLLGTAGDSWVDTPNGEELETGVYYRAAPVGIKVSDSKAIFDVIGTLGGGSSGSFAGAAVYTTNAQSFTSGTGAAVTFVAASGGVELYDTNDFFSNGSPTMFTLPAGKYRFSGAVRFTNPVSLDDEPRLIYILNNTDNQGWALQQGYTNAGSIFGTMNLTTTFDYFWSTGTKTWSLVAQQWSGETLTLTGGGVFPASASFSVEQLEAE